MGEGSYEESTDDERDMGVLSASSIADDTAGWISFALPLSRVADMLARCTILASRRRMGHVRDARKMGMNL